MLKGTGLCTAKQDDKNESWYEVQSIVASKCSSTSIGCEHTIRSLTGCPIGDRCVEETDVMIANDASYSVANQSYLFECFDGGDSMETVWLHEIGHSYGLGHDDSVMSVMRSAIPGANNCNVAHGFSNFPFPDEFFAKTKANGSMGATDFNFAGSPWYRDGSVENLLSYNCVTTGDPWDGCAIDVPVSIQTMYKEPASITIRGFLLTNGLTPSFNFSSQTWNFTPIYTFSQRTVLSLEKEARTVTYSDVVFGASLPLGSFRLWIFVDDDDDVAETDESDNMFPTDYVVARWS